MNAITLIAAAALTFAAAGPVSAQEAESDAWMHAESTMTRAQVQADLARARQDGSLQQLSLGYLPSVGPVRRSRDDVVAEIAEARDSGAFERLQAEAHDFCASETEQAHVAVASR
jgi:uncharacterized protein YdbL (DUF1318 family)